MRVYQKGVLLYMALKKFQANHIVDYILTTLHRKRPKYTEKNSTQKWINSLLLLIKMNNFKSLEIAS